MSKGGVRHAVVMSASTYPEIVTEALLPILWLSPARPKPLGYLMVDRSRLSALCRPWNTICTFGIIHQNICSHLRLEFQRLYTPNAFREERVLWRAVIQLNIVRSIHTILDALSDIRRRDVYPSSIYTSEPDSDSESEHQVSLPYHLEDLRRRLYPLRHVESLLIAKLVPPNEHEATTLGVGGSNSVNGNVSHYGRGSSQPSHAFQRQEVFVRPGASWKVRTSGRPQSAGTTGQETIDESQTVLHHCRSDMAALWEDPVARQILRRRKIRLEESPGL